MNEQNNKPAAKEEPNNNKVEKKEGWLASQPELVQKIIDFINQPIVANAGLGAYLHWVLDPKGSKESSEEILKQLKKITNMMEDQSEEIIKIKKKISLISGHLTGEDSENENANGLNGNGKKNYGKTKSIYLD